MVIKVYPATHHRRLGRCAVVHGRLDRPTGHAERLRTLDQRAHLTRAAAASAQSPVHPDDARIDE